MGVHERTRHMTGEITQASVDDRRVSCRYAVVQDRAWLGWWDGQTFLNTPARIVDISLRGAFLVVDLLPPPGKTVWFCPPGVSPPEWIEANLVQKKKRFLGPREVRIAFRRHFSYETFKAVVYGADHDRSSEPQSVESLDRRTAVPVGRGR